jgi:hypothetical protein
MSLTNLIRIDPDGRVNTHSLAHAHAARLDGTSSTSTSLTPHFYKKKSASPPASIKKYAIEFIVNNHSSIVSTSAGSQLTAGGSVTIAATSTAGASKDRGKDSNLLIAGSQVRGDINTSLSADNQVILKAGESTASSTSSSKSSSGSVGVSYNFATGAIDVNASASRARGNSDGNDISYTNTQIAAGNTLSITSGGSTTLSGATVAGKSVNVDIGKTYGGDLLIESLQDTSVFAEKNRTSAGSFSAGMSGVGGSVSSGKTNINSNFQSVAQQSGIQAGDKGFQVNVQGNTTLTGGVITSTQSAVDNKLNSFNTGTRDANGNLAAGTGNLTITNINNSASYQADSSNFTAGFSVGKDAKTGDNKTTPSGSAGIGSASGNTASVTVAGITGLAGDKTVLTGKDTTNALRPIFNADEVRTDLNAQVTITAQFGAQASKAWGTYSDQQEATAKTNAQLATNAADGRFEGKTAQEWKEIAACNAEGGSCRGVGHVLIGGLTSGTAGGAASAGAVSIGAPLLNELQASLTSGLQALGVDSNIAQGIAGVASGGIAAGVGNAIGGIGGAATAANADFNNRQLHPTEIKWIADNRRQFAEQLSRQLGRPVTEQEAMYWLTAAGESNVDVFMQRSNGQFIRGTSNTEEALAYDTAKAFIAGNTRGSGSSFVDERGQSQTLFTARNGDFYNPEVYGNWRNDPNYRDYYWNVMGINLRGDTMTPAETAQYNQRQQIVQERAVQQLATAGLISVAGRLAIQNASISANNAIERCSVHLT